MAQHATGPRAGALGRETEREPSASSISPALPSQARSFVLANRFLAAAGLAGPWPERFTSWSQAEGLSDAEARDVRLLVLRERIFGPVGRHRPRGRR